MIKNKNDVVKTFIEEVAKNESYKVIEKQGRTRKQKLVYDFIKKFQEENDISPSYEEMRKITKTELSTVFVIVTALEKKGWITRTKGIPRSIKII